MKSVLDLGGIILSLLIGLLIFLFAGIEYLILLIIFFVLAIASTKYSKKIKQKLGLYEEERGWKNVFSNGIIPLLTAILSPQIGPMPYITSVAAITADKYGSEIGVLDKDDPIFLGNMKRTKPGTNGSVSNLGVVASLAGASSIAFVSFFIFNISAEYAFLAAVGGVVGAFVDSIFGILEEKGIGSKESTNILCALSGALFGLVLGGYL